jgi:hypothetical protein
VSARRATAGLVLTVALLGSLAGAVADDGVVICWAGQWLNEAGDGCEPMPSESVATR